jgi:hypothetical protein
MLTAVFLLCATTTIFAAAIPKPCCTGHQYSATLHQAFGSYNLQTHTSDVASLVRFLFSYIASNLLGFLCFEPTYLILCQK